MTKDGARGYSWPPFAHGNTVALKHGADSPDRVRPLADAIAAELVDIAPWASRPTYGATVRAWSWAEAQILLLRNWLDEHGILDGDGIPRPAGDRLERIETRAANLRSELGLSPLAHAKLLRSFREAFAEGDDDQAKDGLAALRAAGGALLDASVPALDRGGDQ